MTLKANISGTCLTDGRIDVSECIFSDAWQAYVANHPKGSIFHTRYMFEAFQATRKCQPLALAALNAQQRIVAVLVSVRVDVLPGVASGFSSRAIMFAEPLCNDDEEGVEGLMALLRQHDRLMQRRALFAEVRPLRAAGAERIALERSGYEYLDYLNYRVDTTQPLDSLWQAISKNCRKTIRHAENRGVRLRECPTEAGVRTVYAHLEVSYGRARVPLVDRSLFDAMLRYFPANAYRVVIAELGERAIASSIDLIDKDVVYGWYGGTERVPGIAANAVIHWDSIDWAARHGKRWYDFGGAGWPGQDYAPRDFKAKFGGTLVNYGRYRKTYSKPRLWLAERIYATTRAVLSPRAK